MCFLAFTRILRGITFVNLSNEDTEAPRDSKVSNELGWGESQDLNPEVGNSRVSSEFCGA